MIISTNKIKMATFGDKNFKFSFRFQLTGGTKFPVDCAMEVGGDVDEGEKRSDFRSLPFEVLTTVLSFVPDKNLTNCALVCRRWNGVIQSQTFWREKCLRTLRFIEKYMAPYYPDDWKEFYLKSPCTRNLIKNPSGKDGIDVGWNITSNGGNGWCVETGDVGANCKPDRLLAISDGSPYQFATSYRWCERFQVIDLLKEGFSKAMLDEGQPDVLVTGWYAHRYDCGGIYALQVKLLRENRDEPNSVMDEFAFGPVTTPQWTANDWNEVRHAFSNYGSGLRFIWYMDRGKDTQYWSGHYGSKIAGSVVRLQFQKEDDSLV